VVYNKGFKLHFYVVNDTNNSANFIREADKQISVKFKWNWKWNIRNPL